MVQYEHKRNSDMTMTEPGLGPEAQAPTEEDLVDKADLRDARLKKLDEQHEDFTLPEVDQAPNPNASTEMTEQDRVDIEKLHATDQVPPELDDRQQKIAVARKTAQQASASMDGLAPGSAAERRNLQAMREARRTGSMNVEGLQTNEAAAPDQAPDVAPVRETRKRTWRHPIKGELVK